MDISLNIFGIFNYYLYICKNLKKLWTAQKYVANVVENYH